MEGFLVTYGKASKTALGFFWKAGWYRVGHQFVMEWKMVWQEILIGFTIAGFMKAFVPTAFWEALLLYTRFGLLGMRPESAAGDIVEQQFAIDYTFFFNIAFVLVATALIAPPAPGRKRTRRPRP